MSNASFGISGTSALDNRLRENNLSILRGHIGRKKIGRGRGGREEERLPANGAQELTSR